MFDPFKDFETAGYLRNTHQVKDVRLVKKIEHDLFLANLPDALGFLAAQEHIGYSEYLAVHRILFADFYPWAGQDRSVTAPDIAVSKAGLLFSHPQDAQRAVAEGLRLGQLKARMNAQPGLVMGLFAYGHPFLDGNGRTMLVVHAELCYRAGMSINWGLTTKNDYLAALSEEIRRPGAAVLDQYLLGFKEGRLDRKIWEQGIHSIKGLGGMNMDHIEGPFSDALVAEKYRAFDQQRGYQIEGAKPPGDGHQDA
jgi:cell filamentation protein